jgi:type I restriction enzyme S subunit
MQAHVDFSVFNCGKQAEYISTCLQTQLLKKQIAAHSKQGNQVNFSTEEVRDLRLPLPPRPVQDQIAAIMQEAYATRQAMLAEAEALREGVDEYVLSELGIKWDVMDITPKICTSR